MRTQIKEGNPVRHYQHPIPVDLESRNRQNCLQISEARGLRDTIRSLQLF